MRRVTVKQAKHICEQLFSEQRYKDAGDVLGFALREVSTIKDWETLGSIYEKIPPDIRARLGGIACGYAKTLAGIRQIDALLDFTEFSLPQHSGEVAARLLLERSWALSNRGQYAQACVLLEQALPKLNAQDQGVAYRRYGFAAFYHGETWEQYFLMSKKLLHGRALGLTMIDEGHCLYRSKRGMEARLLWTEALRFFSKDTYHFAWLQYNIGITALHEDDPSGERHLLIAIVPDISPR